MPADAWLGALTNLDLQCSHGTEVIRMHAKATRSYLRDGVRTVLVQRRMKAALACVAESTRCLRGASQRLTRVIADGAVGHCREHDRHLEPQLRRKLCYQARAIRLIELQSFWLGPQIRRQLHWLAHRVNRGVGHLAGIEQHVVPVEAIVLIAPHTGQQHATRLCLAIDVPQCLACPVRMRPIFEGILANREGMRGAQRHTTMAAHAPSFQAVDRVLLRIIGVDVVGALTNANLAGDAAAGVTLNDERWRCIRKHHDQPQCGYGTAALEQGRLRCPAGSVS